LKNGSFFASVENTDKDFVNHFTFALDKGHQRFYKRRWSSHPPHVGLVVASLVEPPFTDHPPVPEGSGRHQFWRGEKFSIRGRGGFSDSGRNDTLIHPPFFAKKPASCNSEAGFLLFGSAPFCGTTRILKRKRP